MTLPFVASSSPGSCRRGCVCVPASSAAGAATGDDLNAARAKLADARAGCQRRRRRVLRRRPRSSRRRRATSTNSRGLDRDARRRAPPSSRTYRPAARAVRVHPPRTSSLEALVGTERRGRRRSARQQLIDQANQTDNDVVEELAAINAQLKVQQADLDAGARSNRQITDAARRQARDAQRASSAEIEQAVADAAGEARRRDRGRRVRRRRREAAARGGAAPRSTHAAGDQRRGGAGQIVTSPVAGPFRARCRAPRTATTIGGPRSHAGHRHVRADRHAARGGEGGLGHLRAERGRGREHRLPRAATTATPTSTRTSRSTWAGRARSPRAR